MFIYFIRFMHFPQSMGPTQLKKNLHKMLRHDSNPNLTYRSPDNDPPVEQDILGGCRHGYQ